MPFVWGHALSMQAMHGGQAKHEMIDSHTSAGRLRGGMLPQASVYPAERRAPSDVRRRRRPLTRTRAERLAHIQQTTRPDNLPALSTKLAYQANRDGVAERVPEPAVPPSLEVDRARSNTDDHWLTDLERSLVKTTHAPEAPLFSRRRSLPRGGQSLALVRRDEIPAIHRCPRVQAFVSSGRLVTGATASAGNRQGTSGQKLGDADLTWAFS